MSTNGKPTIHLNGTSKESLAQGYRDAAEKIQDAIKAIAAIPPHMRDYYILKTGNEVFHIAQEEHRRRLQILEDLHQDMYLLYEHVMK